MIMNVNRLFMKVVVKSIKVRGYFFGFTTYFKRVKLKIPD